jgi:hypothetical protein
MTYAPTTRALSIIKAFDRWEVLSLLQAALTARPEIDWATGEIYTLTPSGDVHALPEAEQEAALQALLALTPWVHARFDINEHGHLEVCNFGQDGKALWSAHGHLPPRVGAEVMTDGPGSVPVVITGYSDVEGWWMADGYQALNPSRTGNLSGVEIRWG